MGWLRSMACDKVQYGVQYETGVRVLCNKRGLKHRRVISSERAGSHCEFE